MAAGVGLMVSWKIVKKNYFFFFGIIKYLIPNILNGYFKNIFGNLKQVVNFYIFYKIIF